MDMGLLDAATHSHSRYESNDASPTPLLRRLSRRSSRSRLGLTLMQGREGGQEFLAGFYNFIPSVMCDAFRTHATLYGNILPKITFY